MLPPMIEVLTADDQALAKAVDRLRRGLLVAFPTETVYGLGADGRNAEAVASVYRLKSRPKDHPLIVHLPAASAVWHWADRGVQTDRGFEPAAVDELVAALWPGPLTVVLWAASGVSRGLTGGQDTVAVRVPANETALALLGAFGSGVVAPSANRFGMVSPTAAQHVADEFADAGMDLLVLDGGATRLGVESTVIDLTTPSPRLLRPGSLLPTVIETSLGTKLQAAARDTPRTPGSLKQHYAPATPLRLATTDSLAVRPAGAAVIARFPEPQHGSDTRRPPWLLLPADAQGFAHELYAAIRQADGSGAGLILVEEPPSGEEWLAVRDRLERAAAAHVDGGDD